MYDFEGFIPFYIFLYNLIKIKNFKNKKSLGIFDFTVQNTKHTQT